MTRSGDHNGSENVDAGADSVAFADRVIDPDRFAPDDEQTRVLPRSIGSRWPVDLQGVTETVVATRGPDGAWNMAALGVHAPDPDDAGAVPTAQTYGRTRTRRNVEQHGRGLIQFTSDPREFVDAALTIDERSDPLLANADAFVEVAFTRIDRAIDAGTEVHTWELVPITGWILAERVPRTNRGFGAVIDATVAASRLDVDGFDEADLIDRLRYFDETVDRCGGPRERDAFDRIDDVTGWRDRC